jgi:phosphomevalonate kinase
MSNCNQNKFAPGKIIISGEWAVIEPGNPAIVTTTTKGVTATLSKIYIEHTHFVQHAIDVAKEYLSKQGLTPPDSNIAIDSEISFITLPDGKKVKIGLGSSSAVVAATIKAMLQYAPPTATKIIFQLSRIAHSRAQGNRGSGCDVAAAVYGGTILYNQPDEVKKINLPKDLKLSVGFVGYSASTKDLLACMNTAGVKKIYDAIAEITYALADALEKSSKSDIILLIKENRKLLQKLSREAGVVLETPELKKLCDIAESLGAAAKFSGSGGGDCGIAICFDDDAKKEIERKWEENNFFVISKSGCFLSLSYSCFQSRIS